MASSSTLKDGLRQRNVPGKKNFSPAAIEEELDKLAKATQSKSAGNQLDYKIVFAIITVLAFITRFVGISHPDEVVFDEVHFGKVWSILSPAHDKASYTSLTNSSDSSHLTISNGPISSMSILPLASSFSAWSAG